jgi:VanZ family protein
MDPQTLYISSHTLGNILPKYVNILPIGVEKMDKKIIYTNSIAIAILASIATLAGLFWKGLYQHDTISGAAQMMGQDLVTLVICIPILLGTLYLIRKNSLRGQLIWMGTIFYFLYSYASMAFLTSYNQLFLVYVTIFSISLYTLLGELINLDIKSIKKSFTPGRINKIAAVFLGIIGLMLAGMWLKMIIVHY